MLEEMKALENVSDISPKEVYLGGNPGKNESEKVISMYREYMIILEKIFNTVFPKRCLNCQKLIPNGYFCKNCSEVPAYITVKICPDCGLKYNCWERNCRESYKAMVHMLESAEKKGMLCREDVPKPFSDKCIKLKDFING